MIVSYRRKKKRKGSRISKKFSKQFSKLKTSDKSKTPTNEDKNKSNEDLDDESLGNISERQVNAADTLKRGKLPKKIQQMIINNEEPPSKSSSEKSDQTIVKPEESSITNQLKFRETLHFFQAVIDCKYDLSNFLLY